MKTFSYRVDIDTSCGSFMNHAEQLAEFVDRRLQASRQSLEANPVLGEGRQSRLQND